MITISDTTSGRSDKFTQEATVGVCIGATYSGADLVYAVTVTSGTMLNASLAANYSYPLLEVRTACADSASNEVGCYYLNGAGTLSVQSTVTSGATYYVVVDSWASMSGTFTLTISVD